MSLRNLDPLALIDASLSPMVVLAGPEHVIELGNEAYFQLVGRRDLIGKPLLEAFPEVAGQGFDKLLDEVFKTGKPYVGRGLKAELQPTANKPQSTLYHDALYQPLRGPDGKVTAIFCLISDVTDAYQAQAVLHESQKRSQQEIQRQKFLLALADRIRPLSDPNEVTAAASELLGKELRVARVGYIEVDESGESMAVKPGWDSGELPPATGILFRFDQFGPRAGDEIRNGKVVALADVITDERTAAYADIFTAHGLRSILAIPLMKEGRLRAMLGIRDSQIHHWTDDEVALAKEVMDRTWLALEHAYADEKRRQAEEALRKSAARQKLLIDIADLLRKTTDRNTVYLKSSELLGQHFNVSRVLYGEYNLEDKTVTYHSNYTDGTVSEVNGTFPIATFGAANFASVEDGTTWVSDDLSTDPRTSAPEIWAAFEALSAYSAVVVPLSRQGKLIACLFINDNKPRHWLSEQIRLIEDVAERIWNALERLHSEEALRQTDRRKNEFLAMLAHELRNPLAPIAAAAEYLHLMKRDEELARQTSEIIVRQVEHMTNLVNDLLDVSRVTKGLIKLDTMPLDVRQIVTEAVEQVTPLIRSRRHHLMLHLAPDTTIVMGDKKRLIQVVANLVNNAAKYTHEGGNILVKTEVHEAHIVLEVTDDGIGMAPEVVTHVFDLFTQAEVTPDRSSGGLGLGLSLVKSLVELHGGTVSCESEGIGTGSKFMVCLPRLAEPVKQVLQHSEHRLQKVMQPLRILVVDDHVNAANMLALLLEAAGHEVLVEHGSKRALERARIEKPDVCLLDIGMPEMDGNELARCLRAQPLTANSVLIAVTGYDSDGDREKALAAGFDHHLAKPVNTKMLASILAEIKKR